MLKPLFFVIPTTLFLMSCSTPAAVHMEAGSTSFVGETSGSIAKDGKFTINAPGDQTCEGTYTYTQNLSGEGTITCNNGKEGKFNFTSEKRGDDTILIKGYGQFAGGEKFTITFGESYSRYAMPTGNYVAPGMYKGESGPKYKGQIDVDI